MSQTILSQDDLEEIVRMGEEGAPLKEIADAFDVSIPTIRKVIEDYYGEDVELDEDEPDDEEEGERLTFVGAEENDDLDWDDDAE